MKNSEFAKIVLKIFGILLAVFLIMGMIPMLIYLIAVGSFLPLMLLIFLIGCWASWILIFPPIWFLKFVRLPYENDVSEESGTFLAVDKTDLLQIGIVLGGLWISLKSIYSIVTLGFNRLSLPVTNMSEGQLSSSSYTFSPTAVLLLLAGILMLVYSRKLANLFLK